MPDLEKEREEEYRRWKTWDLIGIISWLAKFNVFRWVFKDVPFRGQPYTRTPTRLDEKPPLVELVDLAETGYKAPEPGKVSSSESLEEIVALAAFVTKRSDSISDREINLLRQLLIKLNPDGDLDESMRKLSAHYLTQPAEIENLKLKSHCYKIRSNLNQDQTEFIIKIFYDLAYLKGIDLKNARTIQHIGEYLNVPARNIRLIESDARKKLGDIQQ